MAKKILVAVDGSETNRAAVNEALDLAIRTDAEITAIAVYDLTGNYRAKTGGMELGEEDIVAYCKKALAYIEREAAERKIKIETIYGRGSAIGLIVELSKDYDMVVCGSRGLSGMKRWFTTSVSAELSKSVKCPILICCP